MTQRPTDQMQITLQMFGTSKTLLLTQALKSHFKRNRIKAQLPPTPTPPPGSAQPGVFCGETGFHSLRIPSDPALQELSESPSDGSSGAGLSGLSSVLTAPLPAR